MINLGILPRNKRRLPSGNGGNLRILRLLIRFFDNNNLPLLIGHIQRIALSQLLKLPPIRIRTPAPSQHEEENEETLFHDRKSTQPKIKIKAKIKSRRARPCVPRAVPGPCCWLRALKVFNRNSKIKEASCSLTGQNAIDYVRAIGQNLRAEISSATSPDASRGENAVLIGNTAFSTR